MKRTEPYLVDDKQIKGFFGDYRFLSNFWKTPVFFEGVLYPSVENAFQAAKVANSQSRQPFCTCEPWESKKFGKNVELRKDWEEIKLHVMYMCVFDKFYRKLMLRDMLLKTPDYLEETNYWNDKIWGVNEQGEGQNNLGRILMDVKLQLQKLEDYRK